MKKFYEKRKNISVKNHSHGIWETNKLQRKRRTTYSITGTYLYETDQIFRKEAVVAAPEGLRRSSPPTGLEK